MIMGAAWPLNSSLLDVALGCPRMLVSGRDMRCSETGELEFRPVDLGDPPVLSLAPFAYLSMCVDFST